MRRTKWMATVAATLLAMLAVPAVASACNTGQFCVWEHVDYAGAKAAWYGDDADWSWATDHPYMHNRDSSWANHATWGSGGGYDHVEVYDYLWYSGLIMRLSPGQSYRYLAGANDRGSSHRWVRR